MKNPIRQLEIDHRQMFMDFCDISYDMLMEDSAAQEGYDVLLSSFLNKNRMHMALQAGNVALFMSSLMEEIERLKHAEIPFVVIIRKNGDAWATVSCDGILI